MAVLRFNPRMTPSPNIVGRSTTEWAGSWLPARFAFSARHCGCRAYGHPSTTRIRVASLIRSAAAAAEMSFFSLCAFTTLMKAWIALHALGLSLAANAASAVWSGLTKAVLFGLFTPGKPWTLVIRLVICSAAPVTCTLKLQVVTLVAASFAVTFTAVSPIGKLYGRVIGVPAIL